GVSADVSVEVTENAADAASDAPGAEKTEGSKDGPASYRIVVTSGSQREEHDGLTVKKGRTYLATRVNADSKLIQIEETGGSLPEAMRVPALGSYTLVQPAAPAGDVAPKDFEGDVAKREGVGSLAAVDEITMICCPDLMTLARNGDLTNGAGKQL